MSDQALWPEDYHVHADHCRDVLEGGCYNVPFDPKTPPVCLDLGGNVGGFCRFAAKRWPGCVIESYEPHPGNFALLERTCKEMLPPDAVVHLHNEAVAKSAGTAPLYRGEFNCGEWSLVMGQGNPSVNVQIIAASTLPKADILKIDTEGSELVILEALKEAGRLPEFSAIMLECHSAAWVNPIKTMLIGAGFFMTGERRHSADRVEMMWVRMDVLREQSMAQTAIAYKPDFAKDAESFSKLVAAKNHPIGASTEQVIVDEAEIKMDDLINSIPIIRVKAPKKRVLVACPAKGGISARWFGVFAEVRSLDHPDYTFDFMVLEGHGAINLARNILAQYAIAGGFWKLVQIDADQLWTAAQLVRLVSHAEPIVAMPYCKKQSGPVNWLMVKKPGAEPREDGLLECDFQGTGMLSTEVAALIKMKEFYPELEFLSDNDDGTVATMTELFPIGLVGPNTPSGRLARIKKILARAESAAEKFEEIVDVIENSHPEKARLLGEDYFFSHLARKAGFKLWCDTSGAIGHVGDAVYPITPENLSSPAPIPTHTLNLDGY